MKYGVITALIIAISWVILALVQLWFSPISAAIFTKLTVSAVILLGIIIIVTLVIREYFADQKLKKDGFID